MFISHLALDDFRSYKHQVVQFEPGITVLLGSNGQGKTNLVEAIAYLASYSSHRVAADTALVRFAGSEDQAPGGAVIRAKVNANGRERILEVEIIKGRANRAKVNRSPVRPNELLGNVKVVIFAPEDLNLVKGDPGVRRRFLDDIASQMWRSFTSIRSDFEKVSKQRAALLKQMGKDRRFGGKVDYAGLQIWDEKFATLSRQILAYRLQVLEALTKPVVLAHDIVSDQARQLVLSYEHSLPSQVEGADESLLEEVLNQPSAYEARLLEALTNARDQELDRGVNLIGPHRDELAMTLDGMPVKGYASHGESWSVALSLRLGAFDALTRTDERISDPPILILDDVFSELDGKRRDAVLNAIEKAQQVFITAAVGTDLPQQLQAQVFEVRLDKLLGTVVQPREPFSSKAAGVEEPEDETTLDLDQVTSVISPDNGADSDHVTRGVLDG